MQPHLVVKTWKVGEPAFWDSFKYSPDEDRAYSEEAIEWAITEAVKKHPEVNRARVYVPVEEGDVEVESETVVEIRRG